MILIRWKPLIGATLGTFISLVVGDIVVMNIIFVKRIKMNLWQYYKGLLRGIFPCAVCTSIVGFLISKILFGGWMGFLVNILIIITIYGVLMLLFGMNHYEKKLLISIIHKVKSNKKTNYN